MSGVAILVQNDNTFERLQTSIDRTRNVADFTSTYHAVVIGCPTVEFGNYTFGLTLDLKGKEKRVSTTILIKGIV